VWVRLHALEVADLVEQRLTVKRACARDVRVALHELAEHALGEPRPDRAQRWREPTAIGEDDLHAVDRWGCDRPEERARLRRHVREVRMLDRHPARRATRRLAVDVADQVAVGDLATRVALERQVPRAAVEGAGDRRAVAGEVLRTRLRCFAAQS
jgi:hypothetical protein